MRRPFRVIALMSAYNEGDVISAVIQHLVEQQVEVYLLDNRSTDDTVAQAERWLGKGLIDIETFPSGADDRYAEAAWRYDWTAILLRKEELARTLDADWFIHHDADEIREAPWDGATLRQGIEFVDRVDYNCIDFRVFEFQPVDDRFSQGMDPRTYFRYFRPAQDFDQLQVKCWKATSSPVSLVNLGGHDVAFEGKRVFPIRFLLRHYPIRSQTHGRRKVFEERKNRFSEQERAKSWHRQYDQVGDTDHCFLADPERLQPFDLARARLETMLRPLAAAATHADGEQTTARIEAKLDQLAEQLRALASPASHDLLTQRERELADLRKELNAVYGSRTWRWGEPLGRWLQSLGLGRPRH